MSFKVGDSVKVKEGIMCPDDDSVCISGWQGRISDIEDDGIVEICWDSIALKQLPHEYIKKSEDEGLGWAEMYLTFLMVPLITVKSSPVPVVIKVVDKIRNELTAPLRFLSQPVADSKSEVKRAAGEWLASRDELGGFEAMNGGPDQSLESFLRHYSLPGNCRRIFVL